MKKSNAKLWITIGIIAVVLVIGIIYFANFMMVKDLSTSDFLEKAGV